MLRTLLNRLIARRPAAPPPSIFDLVGAAPAALREGRAPQKTAGRRVLEINNQFGSVEHFYHFMLGYLAPLVLGPVLDHAETTYVIRSCGPMDDHLRALGLPNLEIVPKADFQALCRTADGRTDRLAGLDDPAFYDVAAFARLRKIVLDRLKPDIVPNDAVLFVDRGASPAFYQSDAAEAKTSANLRRTVPNMADIARKVEAAGMPTRMVALEAATLRDQVGLFAGTHTLVAQHGAALVNMLWMPLGSAIVEINPIPVGTKFRDAFSTLATSCGHRYRAVDQASTHAKVDAAQVVAALHSLERRSIP